MSNFWMYRSVLSFFLHTKQFLLVKDVAIFLSDTFRGPPEFPILPRAPG
jgi:hypothetical protein